jgi:hypothetical protein
LSARNSIDIQYSLSNSFLPSKILILLVAACLSWIGLLSLAFVCFFGNGISAGWIFAGTLIVALMVWFILMFNEFRQAIEIPEESDAELLHNLGLQSDGKAKHLDVQSRIARARAERASATRRQMTCERRNRTRSGRTGLPRLNRPNRSAAL